MYSKRAFVHWYVGEGREAGRKASSARHVRHVRTFTELTD